MTTKVIMEYNADANKWDLTISGVKDEVEAGQAFTAALLTFHLLDPMLAPRALIEKTDFGRYRVHPAVRAGSAAERTSSENLSATADSTETEYVIHK